MPANGLHLQMAPEREGESFVVDEEEKQRVGRVRRERVKSVPHSGLGQLMRSWCNTFLGLV